MDLHCVRTSVACVRRGWTPHKPATVRLRRLLTHSAHPVHSSSPAPGLSALHLVQPGAIPSRIRSKICAAASPLNSEWAGRVSTGLWPESLQASPILAREQSEGVARARARSFVRTLGDVCAGLPKKPSNDSLADHNCSSANLSSFLCLLSRRCSIMLHSYSSLAPFGTSREDPAH